ncbi:MAG TPA: AbrB/MazE/SpoVT family DNA-binding domain-containing protein [Rhizomicrobium sp.]|nr:AbrB/MazE/SpoVT family DNA-binding domain-containing protein [Rhizomicrobium sp.]
METTSVTSKGQVTIPKSVRQQLGIRTGTRIAFEVVGDHAELRPKNTPGAAPKKGFGLLKSPRRSVPSDFDPAALLKR